METKKKAFSAPPEGCALGGRLVGLVERPALVWLTQSTQNVKICNKQATTDYITTALQ